MSIQSEKAEAQDGYLTLRSPSTLDDIEFLQNADAGLAISETALRSGPKVFKAALLGLSVAAALTLGTGIGARTGPKIARENIATSSTADARVADLLARLRKVESAHLETVDYPQAEPKAVELAQSWSARMPMAVNARGLEWVVPSIAANAFGEVVFEWWNNKKTLAVYFDDANAKFVKSPGTNVAEMTDGELVDGDHFSELLGWLLKKKLS